MELGRIPSRIEDMRAETNGPQNLPFHRDDPLLYTISGCRADVSQVCAMLCVRLGFG